MQSEMQNIFFPSFYCTLIIFIIITENKVFQIISKTLVTTYCTKYTKIKISYTTQSKSCLQYGFLHRKEIILWIVEELPKIPII